MKKLIALTIAIAIAVLPGGIPIALLIAAVRRKLKTSASNQVPA